MVTLLTVKWKTITLRVVVVGFLPTCAWKPQNSYVWLNDDCFLCSFCRVNVKVKVKVTLEQSAKAQKWSRGIVLLFI